jgi:hypothetical protein
MLFIDVESLIAKSSVAAIESFGFRAMKTNPKTTLHTICVHLRSSVVKKRSFTCLPKSFLPAVVCGGSNADGRNIRGQFHWIFRGDLQKIENQPIALRSFSVCSTHRAFAVIE